MATLPTSFSIGGIPIPVSAENVKLVACWDRRIRDEDSPTFGADYELYLLAEPVRAYVLRTTSYDDAEPPSSVSDETIDEVAAGRLCVENGAEVTGELAARVDAARGEHFRAVAEAAAERPPTAEERFEHAAARHREERRTSAAIARGIVEGHRRIQFDEALKRMVDAGDGSDANRSGDNHKATFGAADDPPKPGWSEASRQLIFRGKVIRDYTPKRAKNQEALLNKFQAAGWKRGITSGMADRQLKETIDSFNGTVAPNTIRLRRGGDNGTVVWDLAPTAG